MTIALNTETSGAFHCPLHHYYMTTYNEILHGFKARCDRQGGYWRSTMCVIDVDAKYGERPPRFYGSGITAAIMAMASKESGMPKNDWIVEVYYV